MTKRRIVILGGGMSALSAAYQLTKTPELQAENDVTLYQMGWRLGGKAASGRDQWGRNLEHGLHVWFGCYENTFTLIQEVYAARPNTTKWALATWQDAVKAQIFTPLGIEGADGKWQYWPLTWASNIGNPGDGRLLPTLPEIIETVIDWIYLFLTHKDQSDAAAALAVAGLPPAHTPVEPKPACALEAAKPHLHTTIGLAGEAARDGFEKAIDLIAWARRAHDGTAAEKDTPGTADSITSDILNIFEAVVRGVLADLVLLDAPLVSIDNIEFRDWLVKHGADRTVVATSSITRVPYDTLFQYSGGDASKPDMAAGTGLGAIMRLVGTYKGAMMWEVQAGMGEVIVGPLYQQLLAQGVKFEFFHKVSNIAAGTSGSDKVVQAITFEVQAETVSGDYSPVIVEDGLVLWPTEPYWEQLQNGAQMQAAGVNFESNWNNWPAAGELTLQNGQDFDVVVLAIALGALKQLNTEDPSICASLIAADTCFANWVNNVGIVPSVGVQLWCNKTTTGLGWPWDKPACVSGPEYLNIWADMTQVIAYETWPSSVPTPLSLHYLTGTYNTTLYAAPKSQTGTPAAAAADVRTQTVNWLNQYSYAPWPAAQAGGGFDWTVLTDPNNGSGEDRIDGQYLRANIDPTECCTLSGTGTTQYRLHADQSGFTNLILAGEGTAMGLTTSFEGSVMSGAAASRAICGQPPQIIGYDFLERKPSQGPGQ